MLIVLITLQSLDEALSLAEKIVAARLAACVQVLPPITSIFAWEGKIQKEPEHLLLIKTVSDRFDDLEAFIKTNHSYSVPEIVALEADRVSDGYLSWMKDYLV